MIFDNKDKTDFFIIVMEETPAENSEKVKVCCLCGRRGGYMIRFERWSAEEQSYALAHLPTPPAANSVTCKRDRLYARRHCRNESRIPKWKINHSTEITPNICIYPSCKNTSTNNRIVLSSQIPESDLIGYLKVDSLPEGHHGLCKKHYSELYNQLHQPAACASCGAKPKTGKLSYLHANSHIYMLINLLCTRHYLFTSTTFIITNNTVCYYTHIRYHPVGPLCLRYTFVLNTQSQCDFHYNL